MPEVDRHGATSDDVGDERDPATRAQPSESFADERQQCRVGDADEEQRRGGRVDVRDEVAGVEAGPPGEHEDDDRPDTGKRPDTPVEGADRTVRQEEPELLERGPDEDEIDESEGVDTRGRAQDVDQHGGGDERHDRPDRGALVGGGERRQQCLTEQEDAEEPERLPEPETGRGDEVGGDTGQRQRREGGSHTADGDDRGEQQAMEPRGDERRGRRTVRPVASIREQACEPADDEEERHDLQDPAERGDPGGAITRILEHGAGGGHRHADHHRVQDDDPDDATGTHEVDPAVTCTQGAIGPGADRSGAIGSSVDRCCVGDGHDGPPR